MRSTPPAALQRLVSHLEEAGFRARDDFPQGGPMSTERLVFSKSGLIVIVGADRGFWYVAAAPATPTQTAGTVGFSLEKWKVALAEPRGAGPLVEADEYPLDEPGIDAYLERQSREMSGMLADMLRACAPDRVAATWRRLADLSGA